MAILYFLVIKGYSLAIRLSAFFNPKAKQWVEGRTGWVEHLGKILQADERRIHVHCASLGEFEQGRPLLDALKKNFPQFKIVLTFFSPSGYEMRKNEPLADYIFYLPMDGPSNAKRFLDLVKPEMGFFVKYEFWHFYIKEYRTRKIPLYLVSAVFRPTQIFFRKGMAFFYNMLVRFSHIFVQNQQSLELLYSNSITQVSVTGDTRFDRVIQTSLSVREFPEISVFKGQKKLFVAGSTWWADEKILARLIEQFGDKFRFIIVPHETGKQNIQRLKNLLGDNCLTYSEWNKEATDKNSLIIDHVGMLSSTYRYADAAYIGGGFGRGIHNILEAVVFGIPVFFGPNYRKFREANELIHWKGAFSIRNEKELIEKFEEVMMDENRVGKIREVNLNYIDNNKGSTDLIINHLKVNMNL